MIKKKEVFVEEIEVEDLSDSWLAGRTPKIVLQKMKLSSSTLVAKMYIKKRVFGLILDDLKNIDGDSMLEFAVFGKTEENFPTILVINDTSTKNKFVVCGYEQKCSDVEVLKNKLFCEKKLISDKKK